MEIKIDNANYWKDCVDAIHSIIDEGEFNISKDGISLKAMDESGISMVSFFMPSKMFSKYDLDKEMQIGINITNLSKIFNNKKDEQLTIKYNGGKISFELKSQSSRKRYIFSPIDIKTTGGKELNIDFDSHAEIKGDSLKAILKDASSISARTVRFDIDKDKFIMTADTDIGQLEEECINNTDFKLHSEKAVSSSFSLEFLARIVGSCPSDINMNLSLKTGAPIKIDYDISDAKFIFHLAPYMPEE